MFAVECQCSSAWRPGSRPLSLENGDFMHSSEFWRRYEQQNPERVPHALKRFIGSLPSPAPIKNFIQNLKSN